MSPEDRKKREETILASEPALKILARILRTDLEKLEKKYDYDTAAWQYQVALDNGQKKKINDLLTLLTPVLGE